jgi:hypothetical protein
MSDTLLFMILACQILVPLCFLLVLRVWYAIESRRLRNELTAALEAFISAPDDKTPSPLAALADQCALLLAARFMQQIKAMLAGTESGLSKAEQAEAQAQALSGAPPWVSIIAGMLPAKLRKQMLTNPQMVGALGGMLSEGNHHSQSESGQRPPQGTLSL